MAGYNQAVQTTHGKFEECFLMGVSLCKKLADIDYRMDTSPDMVLGDLRDIEHDISQYQCLTDNKQAFLSGALTTLRGQILNKHFKEASGTIHFINTHLSD